MREERSRSRSTASIHRRAAVRVAVLPHTAAVKMECKNCGRATIAPVPVRAVFPTSSCPFKVCSLDCGLMFHATFWNAIEIEAEAMEEPVPLLARRS